MGDMHDFRPATPVLLVHRVLPRRSPLSGGGSQLCDHVGDVGPFGVRET